MPMRIRRVAINAVKELGKMQGAYIDRQQIEHMASRRPSLCCRLMGAGVTVTKTP